MKRALGPGPHPGTSDASEVAQANRVLLRKLMVVAAGMFAFGFALVPIYKQI